MKKTLRAEMIQKRRALDKEIWQNKSRDIFERITTLNLLENAEYVMIFMDFRKEVETKPIIEWLWENNRQVVIPRVKKGAPILELCLIDSFDDMDLSPLGILEPKPSHKTFVDPEQIDFVFMPGVAFTERGERLGYGGGYYDQLIPLMKNTVPKIALAFDLQIIDSLPVEEHDIHIDGIITESKFITCQ